MLHQQELAKVSSLLKKLVRINAEGEILEANEGYRPSSEIKMHLRCYADREDVGAVLHAHPPNSYWLLL